MRCNQHYLLFCIFPHSQTFPKNLNSAWMHYFLTCICLSRRLFRVTLEISRADCNIDVTPGTLTATDTCIGYHVTRFEASRKVILHTCYVSACGGAGGGRGRGTKIKTKVILHDKYKSSLRHIHDPVLLSLKMKGIRLLLFLEVTTFLDIYPFTLPSESPASWSTM
jgi:hypothetical protein